MAETPPTTRRITEYLNIDLTTDRWLCNQCGQDLGSAYDSYKEACLVYDRDPHEVHRPIIEGEYTFAPDPAWCRIVEYYCPGCSTMVELEYLPPGHPLTRDIEIDVDKLKAKHGVS